MSSRIVVFGATGYTGELTARALVARGAAPVLAARNPEKLAALAAALGGLQTQVADVADPASVANLVGRGDVLVSTVGPFTRWGAPAVEAALARGAHYLDSTGEGAFIRRVFEEWGARAALGGSGLLTAFGYDWVPGNLAGALALRVAGAAASRMEIGYFMPGGGGPKDVSGGTLASATGVLLDPAYGWRGGRLVTERPAARVRAFTLRPGKRVDGISMGTSEAFALPRLKAGLAEVDVYFGFGGRSKPAAAMSRAGAIALRVPGLRGALQNAVAGRIQGSTGGPDAAARATSGTLVLANVYDAGGGLLAEIRLEGVNPYTFTGEILAWGAMTVADGGLRGAGALGPVDAFGLDELQAGCAGAGIAVV